MPVFLGMVLEAIVIVVVESPLFAGIIYKDSRSERGEIRSLSFHPRSCS